MTASGTGRQGALSSIWEMTLSERQNAALLLENTTARPFVYCRYHFKCFFCREQHAELTSLFKHSATHNTPDYTTILKELIPKGKRTVKVDVSSLSCRLCEKPLAGVDAAREHLVLDHGKAFTASGGGVVAYDLTTTDGCLACHICGKHFHTFVLLNRHMNVHFNNAVCETCGAGFMTHQRLMQHKEIHAGGHRCTKCDKVYTTRSNLKHHVDKCHAGGIKRTLRCAHCSERFTEHFKKLKHLNDTHGITYSFDCDQCTSKFPSRRALTMHTNKHHTVKTRCAVCEKSFGCVTTLRKHMVSHTGERDHRCELCDKSYRHRRSLRQHMRTHDAENFPCTECGSRFSSALEFGKHVKEWHPRFDYGVS